MYSIYVDGNLIYSPVLMEDGYYVIEPKIQSELGLVSTFKFGLPVGAIGYDSINKMKSIITVYDDDTIIFRGRCLSDELGIDNQKNVYCEDELGFLRDSIVSRYVFDLITVSDYLTWLITNHNAQVDANKQFTLGVIDDVFLGFYMGRRSGEYPNTLDEMNEKLVGELGGYILLRHDVSENDIVTYIDYMATSGSQNSQIIEFGSNLIDFSQKIDTQDVFTVVIPLGEVIAEGDSATPDTRLTIANVNDGKEYLEDATGIATYGRICKSVVRDDIDDASWLKAWGQSVLEEGSSIIPEIELSAIDLHVLDADVSSIKLGGYNRIVSVPHGIDTWLQCVRQSIDLENPEQSLYSFGTAPKTLTGSL